jgi:ATP-dependent Clp protease adaptor protein ClpS
MDRPTTAPNRESEFALSKMRKKKKPPQYRVLLHNDNFNRQDYVVQVLLKVIPGMSVDIACDIMQEAHVHGKATIITAPQPDAEEYCEKLRANGLIASLEPANNTE